MSREQTWQDALEWGERVGGIKGWQSFCREHLSDYDKNDPPFYDWKVEQPIKEVKDGEGRQSYLYEVWRIPQQEPSNHYRVFEIAYNLGQLIATEEGCPYPIDIKSYLNA